MLLKKYVLKSFFYFYFLSACGLIGVFLLGDFFERIDEFIHRGAPAIDMISYYFYKIPFILFYMAPQAVLLATVISIATLAKTNEITAMKACGISISGITMPIVGISFIIALFVLASNEYIAPETSKKMNHIFNVKVHGRQAEGVAEKEKIWYKSKNGSIWNIESYDPKTASLKGVSVFVTKDGQFIERRIDSKQAVWESNQWVFKDGYIRSFGPKGLERTDFFEQRTFVVPEKPEDFNIFKIRPEEMGLRDMYKEIQARASEGLDVSKQWVDLHFKLSYPFIAIVLSLIGIPLSLRSSRHGGVMFSIGLNLAIGLAFSFVYAMSVSLGRGGTFGAAFAAWGPIALFTSIGFYLILTLDSERPLPFTE